MTRYKAGDRFNVAVVVLSAVFVGFVSISPTWADSHEGEGAPMSKECVEMRADPFGDVGKILGAGGATRGIVGPLLEMQPESIRIANRSLGKAEALAQHFSHSGPVSACRFNAVPVSERYDLIINATSAGIKGETPPYPSAAISDTTICYDLSYGLKPTPFSIWARESGAQKSVMGWGMLVEQAAESFNIWRGVRPDTQAVLKQMSITA